MTDFPTGLPDIPSAVGGNPLSIMHTSESHSVSTNRILANILQLATKLGIGSGGPPSTPALLRRTATGQSAWAQAQPADIAGGGNPNRLLGTVDGTTVSWLQATQPMFSAVTGRGVTLVVAASNASQKVKDAADYVCTGTDDQVQINAAIAALPAAGGMVRLSEGSFNLGAQINVNRDSVTLAGMGNTATILLVVQGSGGAAAINTTILNFANSWAVARDFAMDGRKSVNTAATSMTLLTCAGLQPTVENVRLVNSKAYGFNYPSTSSYGVATAVSVEGCDADGLWIGGVASSSHLVQGCSSRNNAGNGFVLAQQGAEVVNCAANSNTINGFYLNAPANVSLVGCRAVGNAQQGIHIPSGSGSQVVDCTVVSNGQHGIYVSGGSRHVIQSNNVEKSGQHGILVASAETAVIGNRVADSGTAADNTYVQIYLSGNDGWTEGNICRRGTGTNRAGYGILVNSGITNTYVGLNDLYDSANSSGNWFVDTGTNTRRVSKLKAESFLSGSPLNGTMNVGTWYDCCADLTFYVSSPQSIITIMSTGFAQVGGAGSVLNGLFQVRYLIDGVTAVRFSGAIMPSSGGGATIGLPLAGTLVRAGTTALSVGTHTVRVQAVSASSTAEGFLRAANEAFHLQVREDIS